MPPHYYLTLGASIFAEWGLIKSEYSSCIPSKAEQSHHAFAGSDDLCPIFWGINMKQATKRAASEALAQMLAMTAMLVIASVIFYWR